MSLPTCSPTLFFLATDYYASLNLYIQQAENQILFESYIFEMDEVGLLILQNLSDAAHRGVKVFVTIDGIGSWQTAQLIKQWCQKNRISCHIYHPSWPNSTLAIWWNHLNKRNHRKFILIDQKVLFFGSLNISRSHLDWLDIGTALPMSRGDSAWVSQHFFKVHQSNELAHENEHLTLTSRTQNIYFNHGIKERFQLSWKLRRAIRHAQQNIFISTPYFLPRSYLLRSLFYARNRGVTITLLLPQRSDIGLLQLATRSLYRRLINKNIEIYEYPQQILHSKSLWIDQTLYLGSFNFNHRSLLHDLEIIGQISDTILIKQYQIEYNRILDLSHRIQISDLNSDPYWKRMLGRIFYWFRYWL